LIYRKLNRASPISRSRRQVRNKDYRYIIFGTVASEEGGVAWQSSCNFFKKKKEGGVASVRSTDRKLDTVPST
jgi:hypothetical protein